jgi:hypothetical protein
MKVSRDKYELPEAVAGSASELARMLGITENAIHCGMSRAKKLGYRSSFVRVVIDDEEDDE